MLVSIGKLTPFDVFSFFHNATWLIICFTALTFEPSEPNFNFKSSFAGVGFESLGLGLFTTAFVTSTYLFPYLSQALADFLPQRPSAIPIGVALPFP